MSAFLTKLQAEEVDELEGVDRLLAPLVYQSDRLNAQIIVPTDFKTDYASVPRLPFAYMVVGGKGRRAAVIHDWLYSGGMVNGKAVSRVEADGVFAEALEASGYGWLVRTLMYSGVRLGGAPHFNGPNLPQAAHVERQLA